MHIVTESNGTRHFQAGGRYIGLVVSSRPVWGWNFFTHRWWGNFASDAPGPLTRTYRRLSMRFFDFSVYCGQAQQKGAN